MDWDKVAIKGISNVAKATIITVKTSKKVVKDAKDKYDDTQVKQQYVKEVIKSADDFSAECKYKLELKQRDILNILKNVKQKYSTLKDISEKLSRIASYCEWHISQPKYDGYNESLEIEQQKVELKDGASYYKVGLGAGVGSIASAISSIAAFGTTSGGYAIGSLKGGSFIAATLAKLGGGSVAAGGLGITGGVAVLGALFTIPAIVAGTAYWRKDVINNYEKAVKLEQEIKLGKNELYAKLDELDKIYIGFIKLDSLLQLAIKMLINCTCILELEREPKNYDKVIQLLEASGHFLEDIENTKIVNDDFRYIEDSQNKMDNLYNKIEDTTQQTGYFLAFNSFYRDVVNSTNDYVIKKVSDDEIQMLIKETFVKAEKEICISCPWISSWVSDKKSKFYSMIKRTLERGVNIKIIYGLGRDKVEDSRFQKSKENVAYLKYNLSNLKGSIKFKCKNSHFKIMICDDKYYVLTSYNYLSFRGYDSTDQRHESGEYSENTKMLKVHKEEFDF